MSRILLFLSTGRCGTQSLTQMLADCAGERARVQHEPLRAEYRPRACLRMAAPAEVLPTLPLVERHFLDWDEHLAQGRAIVETGWPIFPWLPYLAERYRGRLDVIHLIRDPVRTAFSMASHHFYSPRRADDYARWGALLPTDPGVRLVEYIPPWPQLNRVERCLFHWAEVHGYAEELTAAGIVSAQLSADGLFSDPTSFVESIRALDPVWRTVFAGAVSAGTKVDRFQCGIPDQVDGLRYTQAVADIAQRQGYVIDLDGHREALIARFFTPGQSGG